MDVIPDFHHGWHVVQAAAYGHFYFIRQGRRENAAAAAAAKAWSLEWCPVLGSADALPFLQAPTNKDLAPPKLFLNICSLSNWTKCHSCRANRHEGNDTVTSPSAMCGISVRPIFQVDTCTMFARWHYSDFHLFLSVLPHLLVEPRSEGRTLCQVGGSKET